MCPFNLPIEFLKLFSQNVESEWSPETTLKNGAELKSHMSKNL